MRTVHKDTMFVSVSKQDQVRILEINQEKNKWILPIFLFCVLCWVIVSGSISLYFDIHLILVAVATGFGSAILITVVEAVQKKFQPSKKDVMDPKIREIYLRSGWDGKNPFIVK